MKTKNNYEVIKLMKSLKIVIVFVSIVVLFILIKSIENSEITVYHIVGIFAATSVMTLSPYIIDKKFRYCSPDYEYQIKVIQEKESFMKNRQEYDQNDLGNISGLSRGYSFEYRKGNKICYTGVKLFDSDTSLVDFKEFLDYLYKAHDYEPTGRVVFRGYWVNRNGKYSKVKYDDFLIDRNSSAILKGSSVRVLDRNNKSCDSGVVTEVNHGKVLYVSDYGNPNHESIVDFTKVVVI